MKLNKHFEKLDSEITLNPTRQNRIDSAYTTWEGNFKEHEELEDIFEDFYQQGSYSTKTSIKPQNSSEFDIDAVLLLNLDEDVKPKETLKQIRNIIETFTAYKDKTIVKDRCVRINYSGDFHMDIVPAKPFNENHICIPCKSDDEWQETNPKGFTSWFNEKHRDSSYKLRPVVRLVKYWRDMKVGKDTAPKSILLSTLLANNIISCNSIAKSLVLTLENLVNNIDEILNDDDEPYVENPSLSDENLARDWDKDKFNIFKTKLTKFSIDSRAALDEEDEEESIEKWINIFGAKFPKELPEQEISKNISSGKVFVNAAGILNTAGGKSIPEHRFYGDMLNARK